MWSVLPMPLLLFSEFKLVFIWQNSVKAVEWIFTKIVQFYLILNTMFQYKYFNKMQVMCQGLHMTRFSLKIYRYDVFLMLL